MKNQDSWTPSKFVYNNGKLQGSRDPREVSISSRLVADNIAEFYQNSLKEHVKGKLLDLGCGKVPLYAAYKDYSSENICIDWGNSLHKNPHLDYEYDLNQKLVLDDSQFDTIILSDVLEHIRKPELLWSEMSRVMKDDGKIIMSVPFYYWLHEQPHDYFRYTKFALQSLAEEAGFKVIFLEPYGGAPEILADVLSKLLRVIPVIGKPFAMFIQWSTRLFSKTKPGKKLSKRSSDNFPLGYGMIAQKLPVSQR